MGKGIKLSGLVLFFEVLFFCLECFISILPSFVLYSRKELTFEQMMVRRVLHFILLEFSLVGFAMVSGLFDGINVAIPYVITVFIIYLLSSIIGWMLDNKTANDINKGLKRIQE